MHAGALAQIPYYVCTLAAMLTAVMYAMAILRGRRPRWFWLGVAAFWLMGAGFFVLALTAGPAPVVLRGSVTEPIRCVFLAGGGLWLCWLVAYAFDVVQIAGAGKETPPAVGPGACVE